MTTVTRVCQQCGQSYETYHAIKKKYCSATCYGAAQRKGKIVQCAQCSKEFYQQKSKGEQSYCSISCALTARNLTDQNPSYYRDISGANNPMYGKGLLGESNPMYGMTKDKAPRWKGGKQTRKDRYILVIAPDDHPYPADIKKSGTKYILEHRHIMEQHLGRYLLPTEVVHHKDGNPSNNHIDNLELFSSQAEHVSTAHGNKSA